MRLVFWQPNLSIIQLPYIQKLLNDDRVKEVVVVAAEEIPNYRINMGWSLDAYKEDHECMCFVHPNDSVIIELLMKDCENSIHLFSGIRAFPFVFQVFKKSLNFSIRRALVTEMPYTYAYGHEGWKPLWLHKRRALFQDSKYFPYIHYVLGFGQKAVIYYKSLYAQWKVYPFAYCTKQQITEIERTPIDGIPRFVFVGSLSKRKNPDIIIKAAQLENSLSEFDFIGNGELEPKLRRLINKNNKSCNFHLLGVRNSNDIQRIISPYDVLILPSVHDGWGAVVNEALQAGLFIICSNHCGAKELIENSDRGVVFKYGNIESLRQKIEYVITQIDFIRYNKYNRLEWAKNHISGEVIAKYMVDCLSGINVKAPWVESPSF